MGQLHLLCGRAGTGKSRKLVQHVVQALGSGGASGRAELDPSRVWIVLPTRDAARRFTQQILAQLRRRPGKSSRSSSGSAGGNTSSEYEAPAAPPLLFGTQVHTYPSLALTLLDWLGEPRPRILPTSMRPALVAQALHDVAELLPAGAFSSGRADFRGPLTAFVGEALRNRVSLDKLAEAPSRLYAVAAGGAGGATMSAAQERELARRCEWLVALLRRYLELCDELDRVNPEELPVYAAAALRKQGSRAWLEEGLQRLYLDGFTRFVDAELDLLGLLVERAEETWATLCVPGEHAGKGGGGAAASHVVAALAGGENRAFSVVERTRNELHEAVARNSQSRRAPVQEVALRKVHRFVEASPSSSSLAWLEKELFHGEPLSPDGQPATPSPERREVKRAAAKTLHERRDLVRIVAPTMLDECEAIAGEIRRLHREEGVALTRMGVVVREISAYGPLLREAFTRAEVPLALPRNMRLADTAAWWLCRDLLACALTPSDEAGPAQEVLRNPLFPVDAAARLQNEARASGFVLQKEWLSPENYADAYAAKLVASVSSVVDLLARAAKASPFEPAVFARALLAGLRRLGVFSLPLTLPAQPGVQARGATQEIRAHDPYTAPRPEEWAKPDGSAAAEQVAEALRERVKAQRALQATVEGVAELLATPGITEALLAEAQRERERQAAAQAQVTTAEEAATLNGTDASTLANGAAHPTDPLATSAATGPARAFYDALRDAARLKRIQLGETRPRRSVYAGEVTQHDMPDELEVVFVAGLMQGTFPTPPSSDAVLSDRDRRRLSELGTWFEERSVQRELEDHFFYRAVTRATRKLYLTHAERDAKGGEVLPSLYLRDVASAFGVELEELPVIAPVRRRLLLTDPVGEQVAELEEGAREAGEAEGATTSAAEQTWHTLEQATHELIAGRGDNPKLDATLDEALSALANDADSGLPWKALNTPDALLRWSVRTLWRQRPFDAHALASWHAARAIWDRFHREHPRLALAAQAGLAETDRPRLTEPAREHIRRHPRILSASGINLFANCPFAYFSRYHLDLEEPVSAEPDAASWGTLHHTVLEELGQALDENEVSGEPQAASEWAVERLVQLAGDPELGFPRLLTQVHWQAQLRHQAEKLRSFVLQELEFRRGRATLPVGYEVPFGLSAAGNELPEELPPLYAAEPLTVRDDEGDVELKLRGYIDLVEAERDPDLRNRHWAVVVDYKSGRVYYRARGLAAFFDDEALEREAQPAQGYQGPNQGKAFDFQLPIYVLAAERLLGYTVAGAFFYSLNDREKRGLYLEHKRDLYAKHEINFRDELSHARFEQLIHRAETMLLALARRLQSGEITINPKDCTFCPYKDVCRFNKAHVDVRLARSSVSG